MNVVRSFVYYAIILELCDRMRFEVDCAKSHHHVISEGLHRSCLTAFCIKYPTHCLKRVGHGVSGVVVC